MAKPYAYVCTLCEHLASRHYLAAGKTVDQGPYVCSHRDCACEITQTTPLRGVDERHFNLVHAAHLGEYIGG